MKNYTENPKADKKAVIKGKNYRFTVLTDRLLRIEYSRNGKFEDRKTQSVVNRLFPVPDFKVTDKNGTIKIETDYITLT